MLKTIKVLTGVALMATTMGSYAGGGDPTPPPGGDNPPTATRSDLTVMTYNIMQLPDVAGDWDDDARLSRIPDAIRAMDETPDVIAWVEAFTDEAYETLDSLSDIYPYKTPVIGDVCSGGGWDSTSGNCSTSPAVVRGGSFIMSKWPIEVQRQHIFNNSQMWTSDYYANKGLVYVRIDKGGFDYHVLGTHMQSDADDFAVSHQTRMAQATETKEWIDDLNLPTSEPVIITGDFNVEYSKDDHINTYLANSNTVLSYAGLGIGSYSAQDNLMTKSNAYYYEYSLDYNDTLDYVVTSAGYLQPSTPATMEVLRLKAADSWYWSYMTNVTPSGIHNDLSDHYPVRATFQY